MQDRFAIANALREIALFLRVKGDQAFRARAYERGAASIEATADIERLIAANELTALPGIGPGLAGVVRELFYKGHSRLLERLRAEIPAAVIEMAQVPEISRKHAEAIYHELGIHSLDELEQACEAGKLRVIRGIGPKTEQRILAGIRRFRTRTTCIALNDAADLSELFCAYLRAHPAAQHVQVAGTIRRWHEVIDELVLVAAARDPAALRAHFGRHPLVVRYSVEDSVVVARLATGMVVRFCAVEPTQFFAALVRHTGSPGHVAGLEQLAAERGLSLSELCAGSEEEVYEVLGLPYVPPEVREGGGELDIALAQPNALSELVTLADIRGIIHCHTTYSDGKHTIEEMARAAEALGYSYITITDHSPTAHYAGGVAVDRLRRQWDEIDQVQEKVKIRILRGTESDILADGSLDYPTPILEKLDVVIASIHSRMRMDRATMTRRLLAMMRQPCFKIWGHALGRLTLSRDPIDCDVERLLDAAAQSRMAIEVNGDPRRLDLPPEWITAARERGIPFVVSTDAHSMRGIENVEYAVGMARRGWLRRSEVLNTLPVDEFCTRVRPFGGIFDESTDGALGESLHLEQRIA